MLDGEYRSQVLAEAGSVAPGRCKRVGRKGEMQKRPARRDIRRTVQSAKRAKKQNPTTGVLLQQVRSATLNVCVAVGLLCLHIAVGIKLAHLGRLRFNLSGSSVAAAT